jgi:hypothetical protein
VPDVRITASSTDASTPLFIGIGRTSAVNDYLAGAPHDQIRDIETDPFSVSYQTTAGSRQPAAPGAQTSWVARATGAGSETLTWPVESGQCSVLAMNADGSQSVSLDAKLAARAVPALAHGRTVQRRRPLDHRQQCAAVLRPPEASDTLIVEVRAKHNDGPSTLRSTARLLPAGRGSSNLDGAIVGTPTLLTVQGRRS